MKKNIFISVLLFAALIVSFLVPKKEYESLNILNQLNIPSEFSGWRSLDISDNVNLEENKYNFISDLFARVYQDENGRQLLLLILDAGNFHTPKGCFSSSGFLVKEMQDSVFKTQDKTFKANTLQVQNDDHDTILFYWLCIDKEIVGWIGQKIIELWSTVINKKKAGLMVRLEIPANGENVQNCRDFGQKFLQDLNKTLDLEQRQYLFGK